MSARALVPAVEPGWQPLSNHPQRHHDTLTPRHADAAFHPRSHWQRKQPSDHCRAEVDGPEANDEHFADRLSVAEFAPPRRRRKRALSSIRVITTLARLGYSRLKAARRRPLLPSAALSTFITTGARLRNTLSLTHIATGTLSIPVPRTRRHHSSSRPSFLRSRRSAMQVTGLRGGSRPLRRTGSTSRKHSRRSAGADHWPSLLKMQLGLSHGPPVLRHLLQPLLHQLSGSDLVLRAHDQH